MSPTPEPRKIESLAFTPEEQKALDVYRIVFDPSPMGVWFIWQETIIYANRTCMELVRATTLDALTGHSPLDFIHPDYHSQTLKRLETGLTSATALPPAEVQLLRLDGSTVQAEVTAWSIPFGTGKILRVSFVDVTERNRMVAALRESEERYRELAESMPVVVWTARPDGSVDYYNSRWYTYTGQTPEDAERWGWSRMMHPDDAAACIAHWKHCLATGEDYTVEVRVRRKDGQYRWILGIAVPVRDSRGNIVRWIGTNSDIHDRKVAEQELARSNSDLRQFAYMAGHDLQEPLRTMTTFSQLLLRTWKDKADPQSLEILQNIIGASTRMRTLMESVLNYARVINAPVLAAPAVPLETALHWALGNLQTAIAESGALVTNDPLPSVTADQAQMVQLLQNLIGNAIKHRGENPPAVHIRAVKKQDQWLISVSDNGAGIPEEFRSSVFTPFTRLQDDRVSGAGIGLAICQRIVEKHGGRIWVESGEGECGSTFCFTLPS